MLTREKFKARFPELYSLFIDLCAAVDAGSIDDDAIIDQNFVLNVERNSLSQIKEVIKLSPFPEKLIVEITNRYFSDSTAKEWLAEIGRKLEAKIAAAESQSASVENPMRRILDRSDL